MIVRAVPVVVLQDFARPMVLVRDYQAFIDANTYRDGDRVPPARPSQQRSGRG